MHWGFGIVLSYLLGSIPFGLLIAKSRGYDIRKAGSGNIGATNVMRVVGKPWGILTLVLDAIKGLIAAAWLARVFFGGAGDVVQLQLACGCAAILGHSFPLYLNFKGGKGVATSAGVLIGVAPAAFGVGVGVFVLLFAAFRYVSLGSIGAALAVPMAAYIFERTAAQPNYLTTYVLVVLCVVVIVRHAGNIKRLLAGTEHRIGGRRASPEDRVNASAEV